MKFKQYLESIDLESVAFGAFWILVACMVGAAGGAFFSLLERTPS